MLHSLAQEQMIPWSDALELGINYILAERGIVEYPNNSIQEKMQYFKELAESLSAENFELKEKLGIKEKTAEQEADDVLKGVVENGEREQ